MAAPQTPGNTDSAVGDSFLKKALLAKATPIQTRTVPTDRRTSLESVKPMKTSFPSCGRRAAFFCSATALALAVCILPNPSAHAQTATYIGAQSKLFSGLNGPSSVAADSLGNIYFTDPGNHRVVEAIPGIGGYIQVNVGSGLASPSQVAVDTAGNVYIADPANNRVLKETLTLGGFVQTTVGAGLSSPSGVAVDTAGNVYIADTVNERVLKETRAGATYTQTVITTNVYQPQGMAVDKSGNVYIADTQHFRIIKETVAGAGYTAKYIGIGLSWPYGVAVDASGIVYIADTSNARIVKEFPSGSTYIQSQVTTATTLADPSTPADGPGGVGVDSNGNILIADSVNGNILKEWQNGADFGSMNVGVKSPVISLMFRIDSSGTLGVLPIMTQGTTGQDFANAGTGNCQYGSFFFSGVLCTLDVTFKPGLAGDRNGAALLRNSNGLTLATGYLHGVGYASQVQYVDASQKVVPFVSSGQSSPYGVAVDGRGDVFIADSNNNRVLKEYLAGSTYTETTVGSGLQSPTALAVDAAGNLFIADTSNNRVVKETLTLSGYTQSVIGSGLSSPYGVATGADGAVYISDTLNNRVLKETPSGGTYVQSVMPIVGMKSPYGIAVDGKGDVFVSDLSNKQILKMTLANGQYAESQISVGIAGVYGIALDPMGNLYATLFTYISEIFEFQPNGASYTQTAVPFTGLQNPYALAVDARGSIYVADVGAETVTEADYGDAPRLTFADTPVNGTSEDSPLIVEIENFGNMPMNLPIPASGQNPSVPNNFNLNDTIVGACPILGAGSATPAVLNPGQACELYIDFSPSAAGSISGSVVLTDDALNPLHPGSSHQTISVSGVGLMIAPQLNWATPAAIKYGTALSATQLSATSSDGANPIAGAFAYTPLAGTILPAGIQPLSVTFTPANTAVYSNASASVNLQVNKAQLTVTAKAVSKTYGTANPAFTYTITGFVNGDTAATALTGKPALTTTAVAGSPVGAYPIKPALGTLHAANYTFKFVNANLTVTPAALSITANNASALYNQPLPTFTYTPSGFVNGDTAAVLSGSPSETTTVTQGSAIGTYPITITAGTLSATNYSFVFHNGSLTIQPLGTVATPKLSPAGGTFSTAQQVIITDSTPGAIIRYTIDGTTPTVTSTKYTAAFQVTTTTTVQAIAFSTGYVKSAVASVTYTIN
jgi:streptogramin lyase